MNENQILFLQFMLTEKGIKEDAIQEELMDHICVSIEDKMIKGVLFHEAVDDAFHEFGEENIMTIRQQHHQIIKKRRMKKVAQLSLMLLLLLIPSIIMMAKQYENDYKDTPVSQKEASSLYQEKATPNAMFINAEPPKISPISSEYPIVSTFGRRLHPVSNTMKFHKGVDMRAPIGTPVMATSDGEVIDVIVKESGYGKHIIIKHDESYKTLYAHLSKMDVSKGDIVKKGEKIGEVGTSGASVSPHLHYEVIKEGEKVNPEAYIRM